MKTCWYRTPTLRVLVMVGIAGGVALRAHAATSEPSEIPYFLARAGVTLERLLAAGVSPSDFEEVVESIDDYCVSNLHRWRAAEAGLAAAQAQLRAAELSGEGVEEARGAVAEAITVRRALLAELIELIGVASNEPTQDRLSLIYANANRWRLPLKYLVVERDEGEWTNLRDALSEYEDAARQGFDAPDWAEQVVLDADAVTATLNADAALRDVAEARTAWLAAFQD